MRKSFLTLTVAVLLYILGTSSAFAAVCDQSFNGGMLRYNKTYQFYDTWNNGGPAVDYMNNFWVHYKQQGNSSWNEGASSTWSYFDPGSDFDWTQQLRNAGFAVPANQSMRIFDSGPTNWRIKNHPTTRTNGTISNHDFGLRYKISYDNSNNYPNTSDDIYHTECVYYSVTWCGDGVRDGGYEVCDPNDSSKTGWGNGGCNASCEPITVNPPATCDKITVNPSTGVAPFSTNISCDATNASTYKIQCGNGVVLNSRTGTCTYSVGSDYTAKCIVDGNITSSACTETVRVNNPTPHIRIDKEDANANDIDGVQGNDTQTVLKGDTAVFKIRVTNVGAESLKKLKVVDAIAPNCAGNVTLPSTYPSTWSNFTVGGSGNHSNNVLEVGEWYEFTCQKSNTQSPYDNEATTQGKGVISGVIVSDWDDTEVLLVNPKIQVIKTDDNSNDEDGIQGNDTQTVIEGEQAVFKITVKNNGTEDLKNVKLTDAVAPNCDSNGNTVNLSGKNFVNKKGNTVNITVRGSGNHNDNIFQIGEEFSYTCKKPNTQSNYTNTVQVSAKGVGSNKSVSDDDPTQVIVELLPEDEYDLALRKTLSTSTPGPFNRGDSVTFDIEVFNQGNVDSGSFSLTDYIPTGLTLADTAWTKVGSKAQRTIGGTIGAGKSKKLTITFTIDSDAPATISNYTEIHDDSGLDCDSAPDQNKNNDALVNDAIGSRCDTSSSDEDDHDIETITIQADPGVCNNLSANPTSAEGTLISNLSCNASNASSYLLEVRSGTGTLVYSTPNASGTVTLNNIGTYTASCFINNQTTTPYSCQQILEVRPEPPLDYDLALRKTLSSSTPGPFEVGDLVTFDIEVFNQGDVDSGVFSLTDYIPTGLTLTDSAWTQVADKAQRNIGTISPENSRTASITFTINSDAVGIITNYAEIHDDSGLDCDSAPDQNKDNDILIDNAIGAGCEPGGDEDDHDIATIEVVDPIYDLALRKTLSSETPGPFVVGDTVTFDIEVFNQGNIKANTIHIVDYIPEGLTLDEVTGTPFLGDWALKEELYSNEAIIGDDQTYTVISGLEPGNSTTRSISFTVTTALAQSIDNYAEISQDDGADCDSTPDNTNGNDDLIDNIIEDGCSSEEDEDDHDIETIEIVDPEYDLALRKTLSSSTPGPFNRGDSVTFDIEVFNQGNVSATVQEIVDYIPEGLVLNDSAWTESNGKAYYNPDIILAAGVSDTISVSFTISNDAPETIKNVAEISEDTINDCDSTADEDATNDGTVTDNAIGTGCEPGGDEDDHDVEIITIGDGTDTYDLALRKILSSSTSGPFRAGDSVTFDIEVFNQGNVGAVNIEVTDYIPTGFTLSDANWTLAGNKASRIISSLTAGDSVVLPITFTINSGVLGGVDNYAEISEDDGDDCDSTPDDRNDNDALVDNEIGTACESGGDEDDHDIETITVDDEPVSDCTSLTASPTSADDTLVSYLSCSGNNVTSYLIEVRDSSNSLVWSTTNPTGTVTLTSDGNYRAKCFVNGETDTPNVCQQTLEVDGGTSGQLACQNATQSGSVVTCEGTSQARSSYLNCNGVRKGPINTTKVGSKYIAEFDCSSSTYQCYVDDDAVPSSVIGDLNSDWFKAQAWRTSNDCHVTSGGGFCGNGIIESGEECDMGTNNGKPGYACSSSCKLGGGDPDPCPSTHPLYPSCIITDPDDGAIVFGPTGTVIIGHEQNPLDQTGVAYIYNDSGYDFAWNKFCIKPYSGDAAALDGVEDCQTFSHGVLYAYEREEILPKSDFEGNKDGIPGSKDYGEVQLRTSFYDLDGTSYYNSYMHSKLDVRVAKPAVVTVGGGTSYVKDSNTTGDVEKITQDIKIDNKNFVGTSVSDSGISSHADSLDNTSDAGAVTNTEADKTNYEETVNNVVDDTTGTITDTVTSFTENYNGLDNVYIVRGKHVVLNSMPTLTGSTTFIVEGGGNLTITGDMLTSDNVAFVVKGGDIIIDKDVTDIKGTYIAIPVSGNGGNIRGNGATNEQLIVNGSLYGDITDLVNDRYYIDATGSQLSVGTIVSFGSSLFTKPAPLVSQFIGEYLQAEKVAQ